jgi:signal transduction histidine kinase
VSAVETDKSWQFQVRENGLGVSEEETEKLFKPFMRFSRIDTDELGLGLNLQETDGPASRPHLVRTAVR